MVNLDSNKIMLPIDCLSHWQKDSFDERVLSKGGRELQRKYSISNPIPGLKSIEINPGANKVVIETSAKILKDNYLKGINLNTIDQVIETINTTGLTDIKPGAIDQAQVFSCDTTQNIAWNEKTSFSQLIHSIQLCSVNPKYSNDLFNERGNKGLVFTGNQKSVKVRMILYDKYTELTYKKTNAEFLKSCANGNKLLASAKGIIRVEQNNTSFSAIRKRFSIPDNSLVSVLKSSANPNYKLLDSITSMHSIEQLELFEKYKDSQLSIGEIVRMEGMRTIVVKCGYDKNILKSWLQALSPKHWDSWYYDRNGKPGFKTILQRMRFEKGGTESFYFKTFNDFKELVRCV